MSYSKLAYIYLHCKSALTAFMPITPTRGHRRIPLPEAQMDRYYSTPERENQEPNLCAAALLRLPLCLRDGLFCLPIHSGSDTTSPT